MLDLDREKDPEQLRRIAKVQDKELERLGRVIAAQARELDHLKGTDSSLQQAMALLERAKGRAKEAAEAKQKKAKDKPPQTGHGPTEQAELEVVVEEHELDEADRVCPSCGGALEEMAGQADESEMIDVVEVEYVLKKVRQKKYRCACGGCVETAPGPERVIDGGRYSLGFGVHVAVQKYLDHLPLERQVRMMKRHGLDVRSQTLWDQVFGLSRLLHPHWERLHQELLRQPVIGLDQTGWPCLSSTKRKPWQMWALTAPGLVYHRICDDKSAKTFGELVGDFEGVIVCDALSTHEAGARAGPGITLAACWAHVQRRFADASEDFPQAQVALDAIASLYALDLEERKDNAPAILDALREWLMAQRFPKTTSLGSAIRYALKLWPKLTVFVSDDRVSLDNNATERGLRGPVVGRKNHYGSKSRRGTETAAVLYSLLETAKLQGVDPARYLREAVVAQKRFGEVLMPWDLVESLG